MAQEHILSCVDHWAGDKGLPPTYVTDITDYVIPILPNLVKQISAVNRPWVLGINGAQGSGKSTLAGLLEYLLRDHYGYTVAVVSIDDVYATRQQRQALAERIHPLLATRGVPGTHELELWWRLVGQASQSQTLALPRFNKAIDDRAEPSSWPTVQGPVQVLILEGWCVGCRPQPESQLHTAINDLEVQEDFDATWRRFVNDQLLGPYAKLAQSLDALLMLHAPSLEAVLRWRSHQESRLAARHDGHAIMDPRQLQRFIQHFERLTRWQWQDLPGYADYRIILDESQRMQTVLAR
ncbi:MAG: hypothetical protein EA401_03335 [Planctomycetota bacterium]|nr:MAG: hypothetical protein EA401_03335 [Planctomycetota bacterium]